MQRQKSATDQRKQWREQEQVLVERWNAATERYRSAQAKLALEPSDELKLEAAAARSEIDALRRQVARLKVEFVSGKRY